MKQEFSLSRDRAIINFTEKYCKSSEAVIESVGFERVLTAYLQDIEKKDNLLYRHLKERCLGGITDIRKIIIKLFRMLLIMDVEEVKAIAEKYERVLSDREYLIELIEGLYSYWRKIERYTIVRNRKTGEGLQNVGFIEANDKFTNVILSTYRKIEETILGYKHRVYRQLSAGANAGIILNDSKWDAPDGYTFLENVPFIESIILQPPFITYPKRNTRKGVFEETDKNPLLDVTINDENWLCYPAKIGSLLAFVYFHKDFMSLGVTLCNLFELAREEEYINKKPDLVYLFGAKDYENQMQTVFYKDHRNDMMVGYANYGEDIDYFGYMKKMLLTLHNVKMIEEGHLPVHGAMVNITMKNGKNSNVVIIGDSGAGKSESLEAFRILSEEYIKDMKIIFDDMGVIKLNENGKAKGFGTEIGAFIRLDDLDVGYAYKEIDRSIFMNPDKINARITIPVATYEEIMKGYEIDYILYANNYEEGEEISFFSSKDNAIQVFKDGARMAKGTTAEKGLVKSYFANPFGPLQKKKETDILLDRFFENFFESGVKVGEIKTGLGIEGQEKEGPKRAAERLFKEIQ